MKAYSITHRAKDCSYNSVFSTRRFCFITSGNFSKILSDGFLIITERINFKNLLTLFLPLIGFLILISSCKQNPAQPPSAKPTDYFPNQIGNTWIYSFYDSVTNNADTVTIKITGETTLPDNKRATIWQRKFSNYTDTFLVSIYADTVRIIPKQNIYVEWINTKFIFPLYVGLKWVGDFIRDTCMVVEKSSYTVPAGSFTNTFRIDEWWMGFNDYGAKSIWFVPKVGIVKVRTIRFLVSNENWELLSYNVSNN